MAIGIVGTELYFNKTVVYMDLLKGAHNKEQAIDDQRGCLDTLTDFIGWTNHGKVIGAMFDIVKPKDSNTFENGILTLDSFVQVGEKTNFRNALGLKLTKDADGNSTVAASLGKLKLTEIKFQGDFTFCDRLFEEKSDEKGTYKLLDIPAEFNKLVGNLRFVDILKTDQMTTVRNKIRALLEGGSSAIYARFIQDLHRAVNALPDEDVDVALTKNEYLKRLSNIFGDLVQIDEDVLHPLKCTEEQFNGVFNKLPVGDKAFLLIVINQDLKTPIEGMRTLVSSNCLFRDEESNLNLTDNDKSKGLSGDGDSPYRFQTVASSNRNAVQIRVSTHVDFCPTYDLFPIETKIIAAHQDVVGTYEVFFNNNDEVTDIQFAYSEFNVVIHNNDGSPALNYPLLQAKPSRKILDELLVDWTPYSPYGLFLE